LLVIPRYEGSQTAFKESNYLTRDEFLKERRPLQKMVSSEIPKSSKLFVSTGSALFLSPLRTTPFNLFHRLLNDEVCPETSSG
jgi:hypothetical protein